MALSNAGETTVKVALGAQFAVAEVIVGLSNTFTIPVPFVEQALAPTVTVTVFAPTAKLLTVAVLFTPFVPIGVGVVDGKNEPPVAE